MTRRIINEVKFSSDNSYRSADVKWKIAKTVYRVVLEEKKKIKKIYNQPRHAEKYYLRWTALCLNNTGDLDWQAT